MDEMPIKAIAPWFGSNRMLAHEVGRRIAGCKWVGVPFAGGMTELLCIDAPTIVVSDLHRHVINLATVYADYAMSAELVRALRNTPFHPGVLAACQNICETVEPVSGGDLGAAFAYFIASWMGRSSKAGTDAEFKGGLPIRWNAAGGDSCKRFRSAIRSIVAWRGVMRRCNFHTLDVFDFLEKVNDRPGHAVYCDPPFPDAGGGYRHKFTAAHQRDLALVLGSFRNALIVCRFYDHPLIRELYPESAWDWNRLDGRKQTNEVAPEVLLVNRKLQTGGMFE